MSWSQWGSWGRCAILRDPNKKSSRNDLDLQNGRYVVLVDFLCDLKLYCPLFLLTEEKMVQTNLKSKKSRDIRQMEESDKRRKSRVTPQEKKAIKMGDIPVKLYANILNPHIKTTLLWDLVLRGEDLKLPELQALSSSTGDEAGRLPWVMFDIKGWQ